MLAGPQHINYDKGNGILLCRSPAHHLNINLVDKLSSMQPILAVTLVFAKRVRDVLAFGSRVHHIALQIFYYPSPSSYI